MLARRGAFFDRLFRGSVVTDEVVGDVRSRTPGTRRHRGPVEDHLGLAIGRCRRQGQGGPNLVAEFLPCRAIVLIQIYGQNGILAGRPEMPGVVELPVQVKVPVPVLIDAFVVRGRLQGGRGLARQTHHLRFRSVDHAVVIHVVLTDADAYARRLEVPVAPAKRDVFGDGAHQSSHHRVAGHGSCGVAGQNQAAGISSQPADAAEFTIVHARSADPLAGHVPRGVAGPDGIVGGPDQPADRVVSGDVPGGEAADDPAVELIADQPADRFGSRYPYSGGAVHDETVRPTHEAAHVISAGDLTRGPAANDQCVFDLTGQTADKIVTGHVHVDQIDVP